MPRTILVTGISGFIAKRIAYDLLAQGDAVRGTLRSLGRADEVRAAMGALPPEALARLSFAEADLLSDAGWPAAMAGVDAVIHTASPFPLTKPKDESIIIRPAVEGTERVLTAAQAAGITRVVLTSSMEAVMHGVASDPLTEADWSDPQAPTCAPYTRSKIFAERTAWAFVAKHPEMQLTVINPGMVCGTPMDRNTGSSVAVIERVLAGKDPMLPDFDLPIVDIEDVSAAHIRALDRPGTIGKRYMLAECFQSFPELARILKAEFPERKIATRIAPKWLISILSLFDTQLAIVKEMIGHRLQLDNAAARHDLGIDFVPAAESERRTARFLAAK